MSAPKIKKRKSGAQYRRERKQRIADGHTELRRTIRVGPLDTPTEWRRLYARVVAMFARGDIADDFARTMCWMVNQGTQLARTQAELDALDALRSQLAQLVGTSTTVIGQTVLETDPPPELLDRPSAEDPPHEL